MPLSDCENVKEKRKKKKRNGVQFLRGSVSLLPRTGHSKRARVRGNFLHTLCFPVACTTCLSHTFFFFFSCLPDEASLSPSFHLVNSLSLLIVILLSSLHSFHPPLYTLSYSSPLPPQRSFPLFLSLSFLIHNNHLTILFFFSIRTFTHSLTPTRTHTYTRHQTAVGKKALSSSFHSSSLHPLPQLLWLTRPQELSPILCFRFANHPYFSPFRLLVINCTPLLQASFFFLLLCKAFFIAGFLLVLISITQPAIRAVLKHKRRCHYSSYFFFIYFFYFLTLCYSFRKRRALSLFCVPVSLFFSSYVLACHITELLSCHR